MHIPKSFRLFCALLLCYSFTSTFVLCQLKTWDGGGGTNLWHDANNWDPNGVPTSLSEVSLTRSSDSVFVNGNAIANNIHLAADLVIPENVTLRIAGVGVEKTLELSRRCYLENQGEIIIEKAQNAAIYMDGEECQIINKSGGLIDILASDDDGIHLVKGHITNQNDASINIEAVISKAIINNDTLTNRGNIKINDCTVAISNSGSFKNTSTGQISSFKSSDGINNYFLFTNSGTISIEKFKENGILNDDDDESVAVVFRNQGHIILDSIGDDGIFNRGYFLNDTTGSITIQNSKDALFSNGISNQDTFDNHGTLIIQEITSTGLSTFSDYFYNTGSISLLRCGLQGLLIQDGAVFRNENQSTLTITNCQDPLKIEEGSSINCRGNMIIK